MPSWPTTPLEAPQLTDFAKQLVQDLGLLATGETFDEANEQRLLSGLVDVSAELADCSLQDGERLRSAGLLRVTEAAIHEMFTREIAGSSDDPEQNILYELVLLVRNFVCNPAMHGLGRILVSEQCLQDVFSILGQPHFLHDLRQGCAEIFMALWKTSDGLRQHMVQEQLFLSLSGDLEEHLRHALSYGTQFSLLWICWRRALPECQVSLQASLQHEGSDLLWQRSCCF
eukprot:3033150-Pleurochrysis_carterae.AAC.4